MGVGGGQGPKTFREPPRARRPVPGATQLVSVQVQERPEAP